MTERFDAMKHIYRQFDRNGQEFGFGILVERACKDGHDADAVRTAIVIMVDVGFLTLTKDLKIVRTK